MFKRRHVIHSFAALAAPGIGLPVWAGGPESPLPKVGSVLPLPAATLLDGRPWTPAGVRGKALVVYWWFSRPMAVAEKQCLRKPGKCSPKM
ncbi:MAG: hypothetical protein Q7T46_00915 [Polaromonas sp.]|nr:hypothetical protein [Polaromonas sp.]